MHKQWVVMVGVLVGCQNSHRAENKPAPGPSVALDTTMTLDKVPWPARDEEQTGPYDCTIIPAMRSYFVGTRVENCGVLEIEATDPEKATARACVEAAVKARRPLVFTQRVQGTDSGVVRAFLARQEGSAYVAYEADYDSNPCGGGCPERGHTSIWRCKEAPSVPAGCSEGTAACFDCDEDPELHYVEQCVTGAPSKFKLADSERARRALYDVKPTMLSAAFGPLVLGAPNSEWTSPAGKAAREAIEAGGIVTVGDVEPRYPSARIDTIGLSFAGPCSHIHDELVHAWGPPTAPPNRWVDPAAHRVATLELENCHLAVASYAEPEQWAAKDISAPFPLVAPGMKAADWLAKVGGEQTEGGSIRSSAMVFGSAGHGPIELDVEVSHGRIVRWDTGSASGDLAAIERLRAQLTTLYGKPKDDNGTSLWRGTPKVRMDAFGDGSFTLSAY